MSSDHRNWTPEEREQYIAELRQAKAEREGVSQAPARKQSWTTRHPWQFGLIAFAILSGLALLAGWLDQPDQATSPPETTVPETTTATTTADTPTHNSVAVEYLDDVWDVANDMSRAFGNLEDLFRNSQVESEIWRNAVLDECRAVRDAYWEYQEAEPPADMLDIHTKVSSGVQHAYDAVSLIESGLATNDVAQIRQANELMAAGARDIETALVLLDRYELS